MIYLIRLYLIIMKTKTKNINKQKKKRNVLTRGQCTISVSIALLSIALQNDPI